MIKYYSKETSNELNNDELKINNGKAGGGVHIGNPVEIYRDEKERSVWSFLLKPTNINILLQNNLSELDLNEDGNTITILELACGNASNSRLIVKGLSEMYPRLKFKVILMDVSDELLKEALVRYEKLLDNLNGNIIVEAVQLNFNSKNEVKSFLNDYTEVFDFIFSIKFFHNTNVKIDKNVAHMISKLLKKGGVFSTQFYNEVNLKIKIKKTLAYLINYKYSNSVYVDRVMANFNLSRNNVKLGYCSYSSNKNFKLIKTNHFYSSQIENYYIKI
jgi:SAM-dependent methyltransferase